MKQLWKRYGMGTPTTTSAQFADVIKREYDKYDKLIKAAGIKLR